MNRKTKDRKRNKEIETEQPSKKKKNKRKKLTKRENFSYSRKNLFDGNWCKKRSRASYEMVVKSSKREITTCIQKIRFVR